MWVSRSYTDNAYTFFCGPIGSVHKPALFRATGVTFALRQSVERADLNRGHALVASLDVAHDHHRISRQQTIALTQP